MTELLEVIHRPRSIAVIKCKAHTSSDDPVALGKALADREAKKAAQLPLGPQANVSMAMLEPPTIPEHQILQEIQITAT